MQLHLLSLSLQFNSGQDEMNKAIWVFPFYSKCSIAIEPHLIPCLQFAFIYSLIKFLLCTYQVPSTRLSDKNITDGKTHMLYPMDSLVYKRLTGPRSAKNNNLDRLISLPPNPNQKIGATLILSTVWPEAFCLWLRMCSSSSFTEFFTRTPWKGPLCCLPTPIWGSTVQKKTKHIPIKSHNNNFKSHNNNFKSTAV